MKKSLVIKNSMKDLKGLEKILKVKFKDISLLDTAVTHRSYLNENGEKGEDSNERLEFLGDAVLELIISEYLFSEYPGREEGDLTSFRAAVVRTTTLAQTSRELGFGKYLKMSKEKKTQEEEIRIFFWLIFLNQYLVQCIKIKDIPYVKNISIEY